jgi:protein-S-isoprenylcysteine O-methyltransferase Ste14
MLFIAVSMFGLIVRARREDEVLAQEFGQQWEEYKRQVPGWIPKLPGKKR